MAIYSGSTPPGCLGIELKVVATSWALESSMPRRVANVVEGLAEVEAGTSIPYPAATRRASARAVVVVRWSVMCGLSSGLGVAAKPVMSNKRLLVQEMCTQQEAG
jgi:hypothetical protein